MDYDEEEKKDSDVVMTCPYCTQCVTGPPHIMKASHGVIQISGALYDHWQIQCSYFDEYHAKLKLVAVQALNHQHLLQSQLQVILKEERDKVIQCFKLSTEFEQKKVELATLLTDWKLDAKTYPFPPVSSKDNANTIIADDIEFLQRFGRLASESHQHRSGGFMQKVGSGSEWVDVTGIKQQNNLARMEFDTFRYRCITCSKHFSCKAGWKEHITLRPSCKCDIFQDGKYSHTIRACSDAKRKRSFKDGELEELEADIEMTYLREPNLEMQPKKSESALNINRKAQRKICKALFKEHKDMLMTIEKWLLKLSAYQTKGFEMTRVGAPICDAIILPFCPLIFGVNQGEHNRNMQIFLIGHKLPVLYINPSQRKKDKCVLVQLTDSKNQFTTQLLENLKAAIFALISRVEVKAREFNLGDGRIKEEVENIYVRQIDYTQDLNGFFMSMDINNDITALGKKLGLGHSQGDRKQLHTLFQFTEGVDGVLTERTKVYNKWVHLKTCGQFKKWMSMNIGKLLKPSQDFFLDKLQPAMDLGLSRIEQSIYFNSQQEWQSLGRSLKPVDNQIQHTLNSVNELANKLVYRVSFDIFWQSFWDTVDEHITLISFDQNAWAVCYGYCNTSYLYSGYEVDRTDHSGIMLNFLKRFAGRQTLVFIRDKKFLITKHGELRQIPIESLNVMQHKHYEFPINPSKFDYYLSKEQLDSINFTCEDPQFYAIFGGDPDTKKFEDQVKNSQPLSCQEQQYEYVHDYQMTQDNQADQYGIQERNNISINTQPEQWNKKRVLKLQDKKEVKDNKTRQRGKSKSVKIELKSQQSGIDVSGLVETKKDKIARWLIVKGKQHQNCAFYSKSGSHSYYECNHCNNKLIKEGRGDTATYRLLV